jgi:tetratricopeptide (TPR) repeat protein
VAALLAQSVSSGIRIDEATAALLGERFEVRTDGKGAALIGRRSDAEPPRTLLGKPTPCVGRDKELGLLDATLRECIDESVARAVLLTGPPGQGKSRLCHEFLSKARERGNPRILTARADPVGAGSSFMMVRQIVRRAIGLREADPAADQHTKLRTHVAGVCKEGNSARIADFIGELVGVPSTDWPSPELRSARNDPQIMAIWLGRSFGEWLAAECVTRPLLVVLEDLHWGDLPSVTYLGEALRALAAKPFMLLALARPEVRETFPNLWPASERQDIALGRLPPRAAERLVRAALGESIPASTVTRIVDRADGNAFYLEELIRRVAEGDGDTLPEAVLALVQSRLERLEPEGRRIVRAASVFGDVFWRGAAASLLGAQETRELDSWLNLLCDREIFSAAPDSRFAGERQYAFRHDLLREAAYAMLTDADRMTGHRLAAVWLHAAGETDALTMADHLERGGEGARAVPWIVRATWTASIGGNFEAVADLSRRGLSCGPTADERGRLHLRYGQVLSIRGEFLAALDMGCEAIDLLRSGSMEWFEAVGLVLVAGTFSGKPEITTAVFPRILDVSIQPEPTGPYGIAVFQVCVALILAGHIEQAEGFLGRADAAQRGSDSDPVFTVRIELARGFLQLRRSALGDSIHTLKHALSVADRAEDAFGKGGAAHFLLDALAETGNREQIELAAQDALRSAPVLGGTFFRNWIALALAWGWLHERRIGEAIGAFRSLLDRSDQVLAASAHGALAHALVEDGDLDGALDHATKSLAMGSALPNVRAGALAALAVVELRRGRATEAVQLAEQGLGLAARGGVPFTGSVLYLTRAEALRCVCKTGDSNAAIRDARDRVLRIAATLERDPALRDSFLTRVDANGRTLSLAREWLGDEPGAG